MKTIKPSLAIGILMTTTFASHAISVVSTQANPANGHAYYLLSPATWTDAELFGQTLGGHLVTINDAAENIWVYNNLNVGDDGRNAWIGLYNLEFPSGNWSWISGEPATFIQWAPDQPDFPGEYYGHYFGGGNPNPFTPGDWNNLAGNVALYGIVEVVPEPSVWSLGALGFLGHIMVRRRKSC
jgi:hypothetical protein